MFKRVVLSIAFVTGSFAVAQAQEGATEFFHQAGAGAHEVTPQLGYRMLTTKGQGAAADVKTTGLNRLGATYEYGINEMFAVQAGLFYTSLETDGTPAFKMNGLEDFELTFKGVAPMAFGNLRYGALATYGFEKAKQKSTTEMNVSTGAFSLAPYVGFDMAAGPGIAGAKLQYQLVKGDVKQEQVGGGDVTTEGGQVLMLNGFYEYLLSDMLLGGALNYKMIAETKSGGVVSTKDYSLFGFDIYARIPAMENLVVIPSLSYDMKAGGDVWDKYNDMVLNVAGRFTF